MQLPVTRTSVVVTDSDTGALGHVSNSASVNFMQLGRNHFLEQVARQFAYVEPPLVVNVNLDIYQACYPGDDVEVVTWCGAIGKKSFKVCNEIYSNGKLAAKGSVTAVGYDSSLKQSKYLPSDWQISNYKEK